MYGTIARLQVQPGLSAQFVEYAEGVLREPIPGIAFAHVFQADSDPNEHWMVVGFDSRDAYQANAASPGQHARYLRLRELLAAEPEWHDGALVQTAQLTGI